MCTFHVFAFSSFRFRVSISSFMFQVQISGSSCRFRFQVLDFRFYIVSSYCRFQISGLRYRVRISGFAFHILISCVRSQFGISCVIAQVQILGFSFRFYNSGFLSQLPPAGPPPCRENRFRRLALLVFGTTFNDRPAILSSVFHNNSLFIFLATGFHRFTEGLFSHARNPFNGLSDSFMHSCMCSFMFCPFVA